jgi:alanine dehydrogenase
LHLAPDRQQTEALMAVGATAIAYETVTSPEGMLPLLAPMSEIAGGMAPHVGGHCLEKENGGRGFLLAGTPDVAPVVILGGGVVGTSAAQIASGMGADVTVSDLSRRPSRTLLRDQYAGCGTTHFNLRSEQRNNRVHPGGRRQGMAPRAP